MKILLINLYLSIIVYIMLIVSDEELQLKALQQKFNEQKQQPQKTAIKGSAVLSILKPLFKSMPDTDFQTIFTSFIAQFSLNDPSKLIALDQLQYIYLRIVDQFNKIRDHPPFGQFTQQLYVALKKSHLSYVSIPSLQKQPMFEIFYKQLTDIIPYEIIFFDSLYKRQQKDRFAMKTPQKLTEQSHEDPYVCYGFKIYQSLLENYESPLMDKLARFFYRVIDFRWVQALQLLKTQILSDNQIKQAAYLLPIFENLKYVQQSINKDAEILKPIFQRRKTFAYPNLQNIDVKIQAKINQLKNILDFVCSYCSNIYSQFKNSYIKASCYFLGKRFKENQAFQEICYNQNLGVMIKFLFARRFLNPILFSEYSANFMKQTKQNPKLQHIMFLKNKSDVVQTLSNYWDNHPTQLQKVALTCGVVIHKLGKGFNKQYPFLQQMVKIYQQLLRNLHDNHIQKQYMIKMMAVRSSKQPIWQQLIVKPQFRLNCQPRNDDCVFLSMLQKFIYGGQQKWNKLKNKSSVASDPSKKHYEVQAKHCPYCNYPTPRCSICLQQIKIFTVKSYLNQQIKRKTQKQQKPYMKLNQPFQQALIWCPSCSHGGHFGHLQSWFKMNKECPVDRCQCKCKY